MGWSAEQYSRFEAERNRPIVDLLAHVPTRDVATTADIGCGPGNSTELLAARYPGASVYGMDSSPDMIAAARLRMPDARFEVDDIATWQDPGPFDVILSNAALQWVPDHAALFPALIAKLAPGGSLAVQMPDNLGEPSHVLLRAAASDPRWGTRHAAALATWDNRHEADYYYRLLYGTGVAINLWQTIYHHHLPGGHDGIIEWMKGTSLRPFLATLDPDEEAAFLDGYREALAGAYPLLPDGAVVLRFPRLFVIATRE